MKVTGLFTDFTEYSLSAKEIPTLQQDRSSPSSDSESIYALFFYSYLIIILDNIIIVEVLSPEPTTPSSQL